jgi:hypothetical protein
MPSFLYFTMSATTKRRQLSCLVLMLNVALNACGQHKRLRPGDTKAREELGLALTNETQHNVVDSAFVLLKDQEIAIQVAEPILFDIYGKKEILKQQPYEASHIGHFWVINGTLAGGREGGTFLIITDDRNCRVINISHGK